LRTLPCYHVVTVDDLEDIGLIPQLIEATQCMIFFMSRGYFLSAACIREIKAAQQHARPVCLVQEMDTNKGGGALQQFMQECPEQHRVYVFKHGPRKESRPVAPWSRLPQYQMVTVRLIIEAILINSPAFEGEPEVPIVMAGDVSRWTFDLSHRLLYVTENNPGAAMILVEMKRHVLKVRRTKNVPPEIQKALDSLARAKRNMKLCRSKTSAAMCAFKNRSLPISRPTSPASMPSLPIANAGDVLGLAQDDLHKKSISRRKAASKDLLGFAQNDVPERRRSKKVAFRVAACAGRNSKISSAACMSKALHSDSGTCTDDEQSCRSPPTLSGATISPPPSPPPSAVTEQMAAESVVPVRQGHLPASSTSEAVQRRCSHTTEEMATTAVAAVESVYQSATVVAEEMATTAAAAVESVQRGMVTLAKEATPNLPLATVHGQPTHFVLYLNDESWLGEQGEKLACEVRVALQMKLPIVMIHEMSPGKGGCDFDKFFAVTPSDLVRAGLYNKIATTLYESEAHRELGFLLIAKSIGGVQGMRVAAECPIAEATMVVAAEVMVEVASEAVAAAEIMADVAKTTARTGRRMSCAVDSALNKLEPGRRKRSQRWQQAASLNEQAARLKRVITFTTQCCNTSLTGAPESRSTSQHEPANGNAVKWSRFRLRSAAVSAAVRVVR